MIITDALMMKAVHDRYGHARAAVLSLQAGADVVLAQGARHEQLAALESIGAAIAAGALEAAHLETASARIDALAARFPLKQTTYTQVQQDQDHHLMQRAWASGLTAVGETQVPQRTDAIRVIAQAEVVSDGVSEAGLPFAQIRALFEGFNDVEFMPVPDLRALEATALPSDGRTNILVSNHHGRYAAAAHAWPIHLHLAVWNPFQVFDIAAPAVITWGYAEGALVALHAWLLGQADTPGVAPVPLTTA